VTDKLLNLVSVLQDDLPTGSSVEIFHPNTDDLDYILYGVVRFDDEEEYVRTSIELNRVMEHSTEFERFELASFTDKEGVFGMLDKDIGSHNVAVRVKE